MPSQNKVIKTGNVLLHNGTEEVFVIAIGFYRNYFENKKEKPGKAQLMKNDELKDDEKDDYPNTGSAYSGSGSMQPGGGNGQETNLNSDAKSTDSQAVTDKKSPPKGGKSIDEATDPSKLSDI